MSDIIIQNPDAPVLVVGGAGMDYVGRVVGELEYQTSNTAKIRTSFGGVARNVAENLARLGHSVSLMSVFGNDPPGEQAIQYLERIGVDMVNVMRCSDCPTGSYIAILDAEGNLKIALDDMRALREITPEYIRTKFEVIKNSSMVFIDANLQLKSIKALLSMARRAKVPVFADPTSFSLADKFIPNLNKIMIITSNSMEAGKLCGCNFSPSDKSAAVRAAKKMVNDGVHLAIVTLGKFGVCYATSASSGYVPALSTQILDPTGAGDALSATVIFALLNDIPIDEAVRLGVAAAYLTLRSPGSVSDELSIDNLYNKLPG